MMLDSAPTPYDDKIYTPDWRAWRDPEMPAWIDPIDVLLTRHLGTSAEGKPAIVADGLTKPRAYIVLRDGFKETPALLDELRAAVAPLGAYKVPESFVAIEQLPRTTLMKVDRRALRGG